SGQEYFADAPAAPGRNPLQPLFTAEADYGLVLLAHQQNILVQIPKHLDKNILLMRQQHQAVNRFSRCLRLK
ncbi:hypothetical protein PSW65_23410, partial [Shigella flexneri]|nr:hypothetical protein [Shigella flexneri]